MKKSKLATFWCERCCRILFAENTIHTCYDFIQNIVEDAVPGRYAKRRKLLYEQIQYISHRTDEYEDFVERRV